MTSKNENDVLLIETCYVGIVHSYGSQVGLVIHGYHDPRPLVHLDQTMTSRTLGTLKLTVC